MVTIVFELILILLFSYVIRAAFGVSGEISILSDSYAHLFMIKTQQKHRFFNFRFDGAVTEAKLGYPKLQHFILSRFPESQWMGVGGFLIILYDLVRIVVFYLLLYLLLPGENSASALGSFPFWGAILLSTMPILFPVKSRLSGLGNARTLGGLLHFCLLVAWITIPSQHWLAYVAVTFLFTLLIIWSSSFALQATIFNAVFLSILAHDPLPVASVFGSMLVMFVLPVGVREILVHKFWHWVWYFRNARRGTTAAERNSISQFLRLPRQLIWDRRAAGRNIFEKLTPVIAAFSVPAAVVVLCKVVTGTRFDESGGLVQYSSLIFLSSAITFALISLPWFSFLGEAERYFDYTSPFLVVLVLDLVIRGQLTGAWLVYILVIQLTMIYLVFMYVNRKQLNQEFMKRSMTPEVREVATFLSKDTSRPWRILAIPIKIAFFWGYLHHGQEHIRYYQMFMGTAGGFSNMEEESDIANWNQPVEDLSIFQRRYGINALLIRKINESRFALTVKRYHLDEQTLLLENDEYAVFELKDSHE